MKNVQKTEVAFSTRSFYSYGKNLIISDVTELRHMYLDCAKTLYGNNQVIKLKTRFRIIMILVADGYTG